MEILIGLGSLIVISSGIAIVQTIRINKIKIEAFTTIFF